MSKIDVSPEDLKRWAAELSLLGSAFSSSTATSSNQVSHIGAVRKGRKPVVPAPGVTPALAVGLTPKVVSLADTLTSLGKKFKIHADSLADALQVSASAVNFHDVSSGEGFKGTGGGTLR